MPHFVEITPNGSIISRVLLNPRTPIPIEDEMDGCNTNTTNSSSNSSTRYTGTSVFSTESLINIFKEQTNPSGAFDSYFSELLLQEVQSTHANEHYKGTHNNYYSTTNAPPHHLPDNITNTTSKYSNNGCAYSFNDSTSRLYSRFILDINRGIMDAKLFDMDVNTDLMILNTPNVLKFMRHTHASANTSNWYNGISDSNKDDFYGNCKAKSTEINYIGTLLCSCILSISPESFLECLASSVVPGVYGSIFIIAYRNSAHIINDDDDVDVHSNGINYNDSSETSIHHHHHHHHHHHYPCGTMLDLLPKQFSDGLAYFSKEGYKNCKTSIIYKELNQLLVNNPGLLSIISTVPFTEHDSILITTKPLQCNTINATNSKRNNIRRKASHKTSRSRNNKPQQIFTEVHTQPKKSPVIVNTIPNNILDRFLVAICGDLGSFINRNYPVIERFVNQVRYLLKSHCTLECVMDYRIDIEKEFARYMYCCLITSNGYRNTLLNSLDSFDGTECFINPHKSLMMFLNVSIIDSSLSSPIYNNSGVPVNNDTITSENGTNGIRSNSVNLQVVDEESSSNLTIILDQLKELCRALGISLYDFYVPGKGILTQYKTEPSFILLVKTLSAFSTSNLGISVDRPVTSINNRDSTNFPINNNDYSDKYKNHRLTHPSLFPLIELINA